MHFEIFYPYSTPTFKTNALCLVSYEGQVKHLLPLHCILTDNTALPWSSLAVTAMHFITRVAPIDDIDGKSHKMELKGSRNYSTNPMESKSRH